MNDQSQLTHDNLRMFSGDLARFRHPFVRRVIYTPGVRFVAEQGGAYWLIDELAFAIADVAFTRACKRDPRIQDLHFWKLRVNNNSARLTARAESGERPFFTKKIDYTDFPLDHIDIWAAYDGEHWTLYLPSEH